ncbi:MAG: flavodoxin family protein [Anaerolineae bacterium]
MKRITAFVGSAGKRHTHGAVVQFMSNLQTLSDVEYEIVALSDYKLQPCRGCRACFEKGQEFCPLKDDWGLLFEKIMASDGVVLASPNYAFQVSAIMKTFLDRFGFVFHRPRFFGKAFTSIVTQGIYGGNDIRKYLDFVGKGLGFNTVKGCVLMTLEPMTEKAQQKADKALVSQSRRFHEQLAKPAYPSPTLFWLMAFRMGRTRIQQMLDDRSLDYRYYRDNGWFKSDYYYPTHLNPLKKVAGSLFDLVSARMT